MTKRRIPLLLWFGIFLLTSLHGQEILPNYFENVIITPATCEGNTGSINVTTSPFWVNYMWDDLDGPNDVQTLYRIELPAGTYVLSGENETGCIETVEYIVPELDCTFDIQVSDSEKDGYCKKGKVIALVNGQPIPEQYINVEWTVVKNGNPDPITIGTSSGVLIDVPNYPHNVEVFADIFVVDENGIKVPCCFDELSFEVLDADCVAETCDFEVVIEDSGTKGMCKRMQVYVTFNGEEVDDNEVSVEWTYTQPSGVDTTITGVVLEVPNYEDDVTINVSAVLLDAEGNELTDCTHEEEFVVHGHDCSDADCDFELVVEDDPTGRGCKIASITAVYDGNPVDISDLVIEWVLTFADGTVETHTSAELTIPNYDQDVTIAVNVNILDENGDEIRECTFEGITRVLAGDCPDHRCQFDTSLGDPPSDKFCKTATVTAILNGDAVQPSNLDVEWTVLLADGTTTTSNGENFDIANYGQDATITVVADILDDSGDVIESCAYTHTFTVLEVDCPSASEVDYYIVKGEQRLWGSIYCKRVMFAFYYEGEFQELSDLNYSWQIYDAQGNLSSTSSSSYILLQTGYSADLEVSYTIGGNTYTATANYTTDECSNALIQSDVGTESINEQAIVKEERLANIAMHAYPNPTKGRIQIDYQSELEGLGHIAIFNSYGALIKTIEVESLKSMKTISVDIGKTNDDGLYFIRFITPSQKVISQKIVLIKSN